MQPRNNSFDVVIVGAGPAGCACALALKDSGLKIALLEKYSFPRDKVCGDAIPGRAIRVLKNIDTTYAQSFRDFPKKNETKKATVRYGRHELSFNWVLEAYTCRRIDFDNILFSLVKENTATEIFTEAAPKTILHNPGSLSIHVGDSVFNAKMIIGADGAHSVVARHLAPRTLDRAHFVGSVRGYFSGITGLQDNNIEIYFHRRFLPSYLWVFPVGNGMANVGFGMLSSEIARRKINLKTALSEFIECSPALRERFTHAAPQAALEGFGLPLGSRIGTLSGNNFMLTGDAASLVDPITGDGIGNAMLSGYLAARQITHGFQQQNFSAAFMKQYDASVMQALGKELRNRYHAQRTLSNMPFLLNMIFYAGKTRLFKNLLQKAL